MEPEEKHPNAVHWMFSDIMVRLVPVGSGFWRFTEDKAGVIDVTWVQKDLETLAKLTAEEHKIFSLKDQGKE